MNPLATKARTYLKELRSYAEKGTGICLHPYQLEAGEAIIRSIKGALGMTFVVILPRQSGKDELLTHLISFLMRSLSFKDRGIVEVNPTYKPQTINAILRLETRMNMNPLTCLQWRKRSDFICTLGYCRTSFLSGDGKANVVGATANLLLIINEAQDIQTQVYDKKFAPMCASTNATRVFCGTVWTGTTLLARETEAARRLEEKDGMKRVFCYNAEDVAAVNPNYGLYVQGEVERLGREHPMIKTQYFNEAIDAETGMFNAGRLALMTGDQEGETSPLPGMTYAFLLDVAGQDEMRMKSSEEPMRNPGRDATSLSIARIDLSTLETLHAPTYRIVQRKQWTGCNHLTVFGALKAMTELWKPLYIVIDASGVGEGLWALLDRQYPMRVLAVKFTQQEKSLIGWQFLAILETGRFRDCCPSELAREQYAACQSEILPGAAKTMRWGVPDGRRRLNGEGLHDDIVMAEALTAILDRQTWALPMKTTFIFPKTNPLDECEGRF